jgi:TonB family protein
MNTREQFGNYLLLKKLADDALGETFRAGKVGKSGMESVVLMRVFNGPSVDGELLWNKVSKRAALQQRLKSPNIGDGVDLGTVRSVPYVAYDYVSGKNLGNLLEQAAKKHTPIPTDHALLITERVALGLAVAYENKLDDQRILHGFLVPQLVMLSNEGETRLLGFEVAPGIRDFAGKSSIATQFGRYLAPEVLNGQPAHKADDVYSLGAILFELLTSSPLPTPAPADGYASLVDRAELATEGTPLSPELANLIKRSLTGRAERIADSVTWHKMLSKLMFEGQYNPTTFNLAFFMHNLFRDEIERESQEIEVEKTIKIPAPEPPRPAPAPAAATSGTSTTATREPGLSMMEQYGIEEPKKGNSGMMIGIAAGVAIAAVAGYLLFGKGPAKPTTAEPATIAAPTAPAGPTPEELVAQQKALEEQIAKLVEDRMKSIETTAKADQEKRIKDLQKQLEDAKAAEARQRDAATRPAPTPSSPPPSTTPAAATSSPEPSKPAVVEEPKPSTTTAAPASAPGTQAPASVPPAGAPAATTAPATTATPTAPAPSASGVKRGDLVEFGAGVKRPAKTDAPEPRYPPMAERMKKSADVTISVLVDENGKVIQAQLKGADPQFGFADAAIEAAKRTRFSPATKDGVPVKMWLDLKYSFKR